MYDLIERILDEVDFKGLVRKQKSINRLFPEFPDRVKQIGKMGGLRLKSQKPDEWFFKIHSGTKSGVWYDAHIRFKNIPELIKKHVRDKRLWVKDGSRVNRSKLAKKLLYTVDLQLDCSCPAQLYYGGDYILSLDKYDAKYGDKENRPPRVRNPKQYGAVCKHLQNLLNVLPFYEGTFAKWLTEFYDKDIKQTEEIARADFDWAKQAGVELGKRREEKPEKLEKPERPLRKEKEVEEPVKISKEEEKPDEEEEKAKPEIKEPDKEKDEELEQGVPIDRLSKKTKKSDTEKEAPPELKDEKPVDFQEPIPLPPPEEVQEEPREEEEPLAKENPEIRKKKKRELDKEAEEKREEDDEKNVAESRIKEILDLSKKIFYHGTNEPDRILAHGFRASTDEANAYPGVSLTEDPEYAKDYGNHLLKVVVNLEKVLKIDHNFWRGISKDRDHQRVYKWLLRRGESPRTANISSMSKAIYNTDYNGYYTKKGDKILELRVFNPDDIKIINLKKEIAESIIIKEGMKDRIGDCYRLSGNYVMDNHEATLVHGTINGVRFTGKDFDNPHAWVEYENKVYDPVWGKEFPKNVYYGMMQAKVRKKYDWEKMSLSIGKASHWGPWDESVEKNEMKEKVNTFSVISYTSAYSGLLKLISSSNKIYSYKGVNPYVFNKIKRWIKYKQWGTAWQLLRRLKRDETM